MPSTITLLIQKASLMWCTVRALSLGSVSHWKS